MITVALPYPHKALWPNGRAHYMTKAREVKKHRAWADSAALAALPVRHPAVFGGDAILPILIVVVAKASGPMPDRDNCVAACKAYLDGIAQRIGVNDRRFGAPVVQFAGRGNPGSFTITIGGSAE